MKKSVACKKACVYTRVGRIKSKQRFYDEICKKIINRRFTKHPHCSFNFIIKIEAKI